MDAIGVPSHKRSERMVELLALLEDRGKLSLSVVAAELGVSEATIRRDVAVLAEQGLLERTHGGARPAQGAQELPVRLRNVRNQQAKARIAAAAAEEIPAGKHAIALTGGTTTTEVVHALRTRDDLTVITNSLVVGQRAAEQGQTRVLIAGGVLRSNSMELVGQLAEATLRLVNIGTAIIGADGVSITGGLTTHDETEARTNHTMIERAQRVIAVADGSKIGGITLAKMADMSDVDLLITDSEASPDELERISEAGVEIIVVPDGQA